MPEKQSQEKVKILDPKFVDLLLIINWHCSILRLLRIISHNRASRLRGPESIHPIKSAKAGSVQGIETQPSASRANFLPIGLWRRHECQASSLLFTSRNLLLSSCSRKAADANASLQLLFLQFAMDTSSHHRGKLYAPSACYLVSELGFTGVETSRKCNQYILESSVLECHQYPHFIYFILPNPNHNPSSPCLISIPPLHRSPQHVKLK